jgi:XapX domain-containing protein
MNELLFSMLGGVVLGAGFQLFRLPLPAPPVLSGVIGIFGVYLGGKLIEWLKVFF